jgi:16S rRNA (cytosine1402-N4)-methyltransferase
VSEVAHVPVLLEEAVAALRVRPDGVYVDGTFGRGGHSAAILALLGVRGRLLAFDQDPAAAAAGAVADRRLELIHGRFSTMTEALAARGVSRVAGVLLDLGVSSPQLDEADRGFSFAKEGPLDMRMDPTRGETAADWLNRATEQEIREVIAGYGEERFAKQVAGAIVAARGREPFRTTGQLAQVVGDAVRTREPGRHPATRTFQALRIHVNQELEELEVTLPQALRLLEPGGRLAVISFHSLEDRRVKRFMRDAATGDRLPRGVPVRAREIPEPPLRVVGRAIRPSAAEVAANPRARSATLRVAERTAAAAPR